MLPSKKRLKIIKKKQSSKSLVSIKADRVLRKRIALLRTTGLTTTEISRSLRGVPKSKIVRILNDPETQRYIAVMEEDINEAMEVKYRNLMVKAVSRMGELVDSSGDDVALHAIEMIMKMNGRLLDKNQRSLEEMMQGGGMIGAFSLPADKVQGAMDYLNDTREKLVKAE